MRVFLIFISIVNLLFFPFAGIMLFNINADFADSITLIDKVYAALVLFQPVLCGLAEKYSTESIKYKLMGLLLVYESVLVVHFKLIEFIGVLL